MSTTPRAKTMLELAPTEKELWEAGCLTRQQLKTWSDTDLHNHTAGIRKTLNFLFELIDRRSPAPSVGMGVQVDAGATEVEPDDDWEERGAADALIKQCAKKVGTVWTGNDFALRDQVMEAIRSLAAPLPTTDTGTGK